MGKSFKLSGNIEEDFKKVTFLLEEINIYSDKFLRQKVKIADSIFRKEYEISVGKDRIKAIFNEYISGEVFLNDAWVITK